MNRSILHIVNQSPFDKACLSQCLQVYLEGDGIIFLENGVYGIASYHSTRTLLKEKKCYVVKADIDARGLTITEDKNITLIDFNDFVRLCTEYDLVQSWY